MNEPQPVAKQSRKWDLLVLVGLLPAAAVLPLLVFAATLVYLLTQEGANNARQTLIEANDSLARVVQTELNRSAEDLERLSLAAAADSKDPELASRLASSLVGPGRPFSAILLASPEGERVLAGNPAQDDSAGSSPSQRGGTRGFTNFRKTGGLQRGVVEVLAPFQAQEGSTLVGQMNLMRLARPRASQAGSRS